MLNESKRPMIEGAQMDQRKKGICLVLIGASLWGASGVAVQFLLQDKLFSPEWLVVVRLIASGTLLLLYDYAANGGDIFSVWKIPRDRNQLLLFGILGMLSVQYTYFVAIMHSNAATATILQYLMPVIIVCYIALRYKKAPNLLEIFAIALAMFGVYLLVTKGDFGNLAISPLALVWGAASAFSSAFYTLQPKYLLGRWRAPLVIGWGLFVGGVFMSVFYPPWHFAGTWDAQAFGALVFIVLFGTILAFCAYLGSIRYIRPTETSTIASVEPLAAVALSIWLLDISFGPVDCAGGLCILSTVFILAKAK